MRTLFSLLLLPLACGLYAQDNASGLYFAGKTQKAAEAYAEVAESSPTPAAFLNAAFCFDETADPKAALSELKQAAKLYPENTAVRSAYAAALLARDKKSDVLDTLEESSSTLSAYDLFTLGRAYYHKGHDDKAADAFSEALKKEPYFTAARYFLALALEDSGKHAEAAREYEKVLKQDFQFVEAKKSAAQLYADAGKTNDAWKYFKQSSLADPSDKSLKQNVTKLTALITKKPDEIIPPKKIRSHRRVKKTVNDDKSIMLRIGIGTTIGGAPIKKRSVEFTVSSPFTIQQGMRTIASGDKNESWTITLATTDRQAYAMSPSSETAAVFAGGAFIVPDKTNATIIVRKLLTAHGTAWAGVADKELRGRLEVIADSAAASLNLINHVNMEEYLYGVVPYEMPATFPPEALKAQAVMARTYALNHLGEHAKYGYDLCDGQHCQVYGGVTAEAKSARDAVDATRSLVVKYNGRPVSAVFSSNSGGFTQDGKNAGWNDMPYWHVASDYPEMKAPPEQPYSFRELLLGRPQSYSAPSKFVSEASYRWSRVVYADDLARRINNVYKIGKIKQLIVLKRGRSGHINSLRVVGTKDTADIVKEYEIRKFLGLGLLRSTDFIFDTHYGGWWGLGKPDYFVFYGAGWGHGVGFCQSGASGRAAAGQDYKEIIEHYYPNTKLEPLKK